MRWNWAEWILWILFFLMFVSGMITGVVGAFVQNWTVVQIGGSLVMLGLWSTLIVWLHSEV